MIWPLEWQWKFYNVNWVGPISCYIIICTWFVWSQVHYNFMSTHTLMKKKNWGITNFIVVQLSHLKKWSKTGQWFFYMICRKLRIKNPEMWTSFFVAFLQIYFFNHLVILLMKNDQKSKFSFSFNIWIDPQTYVQENWKFCV